LTDSAAEKHVQIQFVLQSKPINW